MKNFIKKLFPSGQEIQNWDSKDTLNYIASWIAVIVFLGSLAVLIYGSLTSLCDKEESLFQTKNFRVLVLPFNQYGCLEGNDCGEVVAKRLAELNLRDTLNIEVRFKEVEIDANFNKDKAEEIQKNFESDIVIYGSRFSNECNTQNDDEVCLNYMTKDNLNLPVTSEIILSDPKSATLNEIWNGKLQGNIDFIIYWVAGMHELFNGNYQRAKKRAEYILENVTHKNADAFHFASLCYWLTNNNQLASNYANKALNIDSTHVGALNIRGTTKYENHQYQEAIKDFEKAIKFDPYDGHSYMNRANSKDDMGLHEEAILDYNKAVELMPEYYLVYLNRGVAKRKIGEYEEAILDYNKSLKLKPDNSMVYFNIAGALTKMGRIEEAIDNLDIAVKLNPYDFMAYNVRGIRKMEINDFNGAILDFTKAILIDSNFAHAYNNRAEVYLKKLNDTSSALNDYNKVIELNPKSTLAYYHRARIYESKNRIIDAINDLDEQIKLDSNFTNAYHWRGFYKGNQGYYKEALRDFNKAIELDSNYPQAYYSRGIVYEILNNKEAALNDFKKSEELGFKLK